MVRLIYVEQGIWYGLGLAGSEFFCCASNGLARFDWSDLGLSRFHLTYLSWVGIELRLGKCGVEQGLRLLVRDL